MQIHIEQGRVVIELTPTKFQAFSFMFANLGTDHNVIIEGLDWPSGNPRGRKYRGKILPMHLCRTIGEACAVEQAGPLDILSLYPFWKYGSARADSQSLPKTGQDGFRNIVDSIKKEPFLLSNNLRLLKRIRVAVEHVSSGLAGSRRRARRPPSARRNPRPPA